MPDDRPPYEDALRTGQVVARLAAFDPHVVGTLPLGLAVAGSDIDIVCHAPDVEAFAAILASVFSGLPGFSIRRWTEPPRPVICRFVLLGWPVEIFGAPVPVRDQAGWRHFDIERRLLALGGDALRGEVQRRRTAGEKTEPAFAQALGLTGDPYARLFEMQPTSDIELQRTFFAPVA